MNKCMCVQVMGKDDFLEKLRAMASNAADKTTAKYASRVIDRISGARKWKWAAHVVRGCPMRYAIGSVFVCLKN